MTKRIILTIIAIAVAVAALRAGIDDLPVAIIDGKAYHYYDVAPKQTVYSICRELGITKAELIEANPSVGEDGLKAYQRLLFAAATQPAAAADPDAAAAPAEPTIHIVKKRETIYGISHAYGLTPSQLEAWNPGIRDGLREGDRLIVSDPLAAAAPATAAPEAYPAPAFRTYTVKDRETFYSIAHANGITVAQLEEANPEVTLLRPGMELRIPNGNAAPAPAPAPAAPVTTPVTEPVTEPVTTPVTNPVTNPVAEPEQAPAPKAEEINIAVVLPFMLGEEQRSRRAEHFTEWYKGFLLAIDSMRYTERPIKIQTYDTEGSDQTLSRIILNPELAKANVIIAPDNATHLDRLAAYGAEHGIDVMNLFVVADKNYSSNPALYQATIPHDEMYQAAVSAIVKDIESGYTPVILTPTDGRGDKQSFVDMLTHSLKARGIDYTTIEYQRALTAEQLAGLDRDKRYAFIPNTAAQADLNRILPALIELRSGMTAFDPLRIYGYPEWTTFRGETLSNMHAANTYVYSRFFTSPDDPWAKQVEEAFERWYGTPMAAAVPRQGLLGFDTGMFLISALRSGDPLTEAPVYHGVQNAFRFVRPRGIAGFVNVDLYFVNYRPSGLTDRINL